MIRPTDPYANVLSLFLAMLFEIAAPKTRIETPLIRVVANLVNLRNPNVKSVVKKYKKSCDNANL